MKKLQIGEIIYRLRKDKGITQQQLAKIIGVSTAAISKWESGNSYPDITLLPILAKFFNVTIDTLLNFDKDLSDEKVKEIYEECEELFNNSDMSTAIKRTKEYLNKYPSSYFLMSRIAFLYTIYSWKTEDEEKCTQILNEAVELYEEVVSNCNDTKLVEVSLFALGSLYATLGREEEAISTLNKINKSQCDPDDIMASIYIKQKKYQDARKLLQSKLFKSINDISNICLSLGNTYCIYEQDYDLAERYYNLGVDIKNLFQYNGKTVFLLNEYLQLAQLFINIGNKIKAIDMLKQMIDSYKNHDFTNIEGFKKLWCFDELKQSKYPIKINIYENILVLLKQSIFDPIREEKEFKKIFNEIEKLNKIIN
ncbi:helix-turn-helix domain-containing protein [Vallitalea maricola]|uniref:Helix-turn-helix transcriptional regulator n=1 Tax=Vallitalea maricola TaxID=3074433 RepID=A0ACB5UP32_9FIRM|nr:helix-turn-helix transcriptional regulator [Vallitalea sp. AN17-2]